MPDLSLTATSTSVEAILVASIALVLLAPIIARVLRRQFDPFEPIVLFALAYGVMFVVRPLAMIARGDRSWGPFHRIDIAGTIGSMLFLALIGAVAFVAAYELLPRVGRPARPPHREDRLDNGLAVKLALGVAALAVASFLLFLAVADWEAVLRDIARGDTGALKQETKGTSTYLWLAWNGLIPAGLVLLAVGMQSRNVRVLALGALVTALFLARAVPTGSRIMLLPLFGGLFVVYYLRKRRRPRLVLLALLIAVAVLASTALRDVRSRDARDETVAQTLEHIVTQPGWIYDPLLSGPDAEMAPALAAALEYIPERLPYTYGKTTFGDLVTRPVPRVLWSDKPLAPREKLLATMFPQEYRAGGINSEFSVLLYFYWDFGMLGIAVGLALLGVCFRRLYDWLQRDEGILMVQVVYALSLWFVPLALRDSPVDSLIKLVILVLPAWLILKLASASTAATTLASTRDRSRFAA
jgi:hypothetical protein